MFAGIDILKTQNFERVNLNTKFSWEEVESMKNGPEEHLVRLIEQDLGEDYNIIVFCDTQKTCDHISSVLFDKDIPNLPYYAGMESMLRFETLHQMYNGKCRVIVGTNLLRGIDTLNVGHVIQYNFARSPEDFIHR